MISHLWMMTMTRSYVCALENVPWIWFSLDDYLYTFFNCLKSKVALQMWRTRYESKSLCTSEGLPGPGWNPKDGDAWRSNDLQLLDMKIHLHEFTEVVWCQRGHPNRPFVSVQNEGLFFLWKEESLSKWHEFFAIEFFFGCFGGWALFAPDV